MKTHENSLRVICRSKSFPREKPRTPLKGCPASRQKREGSTRKGTKELGWTMGLKDAAPSKLNHALCCLIPYHSTILTQNSGDGNFKVTVDGVLTTMWRKCVKPRQFSYIYNMKISRFGERSTCTISKSYGRYFLR